MAISNTKAHLEIENRRNFQNHTGSFSGVETHGNGPLTFGILPNEYRSDVVNADYVVYSYATPIGWYRADSGWTIPNEKYSVTTSRHQSALRHGAGTY